MRFVIEAIDTSGNDLFSTLKNKGYQIPSNDIVKFETTKISYADSIPENILDNDQETFWGSDEIYPSLTIDFVNNKFSLKGFSIHGIYNPYSTAFNILGSYNRINWELIEEYKDLGETLHNKLETFQFDECQPLYNSIKIQCIESQIINGGVTNKSCGIRELKIYGILISHQYFFCTKNSLNKIQYHVLIKSFLLYFI